MTSSCRLRWKQPTTSKSPLKKGKLTISGKTNVPYKTNSGVDLFAYDSTVVCKGGENFNDLQIGFINLQDNKSAGNIKLTGPVEALCYSTVQKTSGVFTIAPVCTQQGSLASGLTDIATSNYQFSCKSPAKIVIKGIYQGKGIATLQTL